MIGNDVIDLALAQKESNWRRKGYLDKIFTPLEQEFIKVDNHPDEMVWRLWSRKEAVYKIIRQIGWKRGFYPTAIECLDSSLTNSKVVFNQSIFFTNTIQKDSLIHTIGLTATTDFQFVTMIENEENVIKFEEIPYLILENRRYAASKSHHGRFERVVCLLKN